MFWRFPNRRYIGPAGVRDKENDALSFFWLEGDRLGIFFKVSILIEYLPIPILLETCVCGITRSVSLQYWKGNGFDAQPNPNS